MRRHGSRHSSGFERLWAATLVGNLGDGMRQTAIPLIVAATTRDPQLVSAVAFANRLPWLVFTPVAGALLDRFDRGRLMALGHLAQAGAALALVGLVLPTEPQHLALVLIAFVTGSIEVLVDNAEQVFTADLVEPSGLDRANSLIYGGFVALNQLLGPAIGAVLFGLAMYLPFASGAIMFLCAAILVASIGRLSKPVTVSAATDSEPGERVGAAAGLRWLAGNRTLLVLASSSGLQNLIASAGLAIAVLFALEVLALPAYGFGLLLSVAAVGGLVGSAVATRATRLGSTRAVLVLANSVMGIALVGFGFAPGAIVAAVALAVVEFAATVWNVLAIGLRQRLVPNELLGCVNAAYRLVAWGGMPLGTLAGGVLGSWLGLRAPFVVGGLALLGVSLMLIALLPRAADLEPSSR